MPSASGLEAARLHGRTADTPTSKRFADSSVLVSGPASWRAGTATQNRHEGRIDADRRCLLLLLTPVLHRWLDGRNSNEMLFRFTCEQWSHAFKAAGESCGLGCLGPLTLQQLRHGWAKSNAEGRVPTCGSSSQRFVGAAWPQHGVLAKPWTSFTSARDRISTMSCVSSRPVAAQVAQP